MVSALPAERGGTCPLPKGLMVGLAMYVQSLVCGRLACIDLLPSCNLHQCRLSYQWVMCTDVPLHNLVLAVMW